MFVATKSALMDALKLVGQVVERRNTIPILSNVLFEKQESGRLAARVTDLDIEATIPFASNPDRDFRAFTVPAHLLHDIIRKLPDDADIKIEAADEALSGITVKSGRSKFRLQVLPAEDFASMQAGDLPYSFEMQSSALASAIAGVSFAISTEETRYYLNGIFLHPDDDGMKFVATDGHRLAKRFISIENPPMGMPGVIVPKKTVDTIAKQLPKDGTVQIAVSDAKIRFTIGDMVLTSKLIDGNFPDYVRVIPGHEGFVELDGKAFTSALDRVSTVSTGSRAVKMTFTDGTLKLLVSNPDAGDGEDELSFEGEADLTIGFNAKYVTEALSRMPEGDVRLHLGTIDAPAVLRADGDHAENLIVLMPMRV